MLRKNYLIYLLVILIPFAALCGGIAYVSAMETCKAIDTSNRNTLLQARNEMDLIVDDVSYLYVSLSVNSEVNNILGRVSRNASIGSLENDMRSITSNILIPSVVARPYINSIYIYVDNEYGRFVDAVEGLRLMDGFGDLGWYDSYQAHKKEQMQSWSEMRSYYRYEFEQEPVKVITLYRRMFRGNGVVVLNLLQQNLIDMIDELQSDESQSFYLYNDKGELLLSCGRHMDAQPEAILEASNKGDMGSEFNVGIGGTAYSVSVQESKAYNWRFVSLIPMESVYRAPYRMFLFALIATALVFVICSIFYFRYVRRSCRYVENILKLFESEDMNFADMIKIPKSNSLFTIDEYEMIAKNIIRTFLERNSLKQNLLKEEHEKQKLELMALRSQISPHFLVNTVRSIFWMSFKLTQSKNEVSEMIESLMNILDYSLSSHDSVVTFSQELDHAKNYVALQQMHYHDKFTVAFKYPYSVLDCRCIKLLLQPLIENSIAHGIDWKAKRMLHVYVRIRSGSNGICVTVSDNGVGIPSDKLEEVRERLKQGDDQGHIGMYNCNRRLILTYGEGYRLTIRSREGKGTSVKVRLPFCTEDEWKQAMTPGATNDTVSL